MRSVSQAEFEQISAGAKVLERQQEGPSALRSVDGCIIKIWRRGGVLSSDRLRPYSKRFAENCQRLNANGIPAPKVKDRFRVRETGEHVLIYPLLPGRPLVDLAEQGELPINQLADFYAELHGKGILFRSIHLGNVLLLDEGRMGLIDVTDCSFYQRPLGLKLRGINLAYAWSYRGDHVHFDAAVRERMWARYVDQAGLDASQARRLNGVLQAASEHYTARRAKRRQQTLKRKAREQRAAR